MLGRPHPLLEEGSALQKWSLSDHRFKHAWIRVVSVFEFSFGSVNSTVSVQCVKYPRCGFVVRVPASLILINCYLLFHSL